MIDNVINVVDQQPKKKRGRKPKQVLPVEKIDNDTNNSNENTLNDTGMNLETNDEAIVKKYKKRGRKPKNKFNVETNFEEYNNLASSNTNHIIKIPIDCLKEEQSGHLQIFDNNISTIDAFNQNTEQNYEYNCDFYNKEKEFEQSLLELINMYFSTFMENTISNDFKKDKDNFNTKYKYISIIENILNDLKNINSLDEYHNYHNDNINSLIPDNKNNFDRLNIHTPTNNMNSTNDYYNNKKKEIFNELNNTNLSQIEILINKKYRHTKQISLMNNICNSENTTWPTSTNILCFWCCHSFENIPWGLPTKYENGKFTLTGIYCTPNCAMSHLLNTEKNNNNLWERIVLLNLLHHKIYETDENIVPAPDKISLQAFGGPFNINEYRYLTLENKKNYTITFPPCNIMAPVLEETKKLTNQENYFIPIDMNKVHKINSELKIKRRKTKHHTNTLFNFTEN